MRWQLTALSGVCVHPGYGAGPAFLPGDIGDDEPPADGSVLIAKEIEPVQVPLLFTCTAIVLENDDLASHAAITARELGIPALAGVAGATEQITAGQRLFVDTERGRILRVTDQAGACPFCAPDTVELFGGVRLRVIEDMFPVVRSHLLVVPRRHVTDPAALTGADWSELGELVAEIRSWLRDTGGITDLNLAMNIGPAAGQTIEHLHWHLLPRRPGDDADPRGGVRRLVSPPYRPYPRPDGPAGKEDA